MEVRSSTNEAMLSRIKIKTLEKTPVEKRESCLFSVMGNVEETLSVNRCSAENLIKISLSKKHVHSWQNSVVVLGKFRF